MILKGISVNQDPPTKDYLWITPKGNTRFWNQSTWMLIGGNGGGGGADIPTIEAAGKYLVTTGTEGNYSMAWSDINLSSYINGTSGYAAVFNSSNSIISAIGNNSKIRIGNGIIEWDSTNNGFKIYNATSTQETPTTAGIYADWVSALGVNSSGGGGGGGMDETALWQELTDDPQWTLDDDKIININHLPNNINADTVDGYHANSFAFANGTNSTGTWGISITGNAATATKATQDGNGNTISSTYLPLAGGTMTGNLNLKANQYSREGALNCQNSDIININSLLFADLAGDFGEGLCFYRSATTWDCLTANSGTFYFGSNKTYGAALAGDAIINCGAIRLNAANAIIYNSQGYCILQSNNSDKYTLLNYDGSTNRYVLYLDGYDIRFRHGISHVEAMRISSAGNVGIGTPAPSYKLDVVGDIKSSTNIHSIGAGEHYVEAQDTTSSLRCLIDCTNSQQGLWTNGYWNGSSFVSSSLWMFYRTTDGHLVLGSNTETKGNFWATGGVTALQTSSSDKRLKKEIKPFNAKQIIDKLSPVEFEWNKKANKYNSNLELNKKNYGLIAQDSDGIIDNLVFDLPDGKGYKGVRYEKLIPILLQAVKEQQKEIDELKQIIKKLKV